jgi:hypothetical protein
MELTCSRQCPPATISLGATPNFESVTRSKPDLGQSLPG